jgi:deazaflavin-dependent oxidoreductase (nitroreductase family)
MYRVGLGWLLGDRFLMLTHVGRKSGLPRQVVLEVVKHDRDTDVYYVAVGFGERTDWYRNILKKPEVIVNAGRRRWAARAERLPPGEAEMILLDYAHRHPLAIRELARVLGYRVDGTPADYAKLGRSIPIIALRPVQLTQ